MSHRLRPRPRCGRPPRSKRAGCCRACSGSSRGGGAQLQVAGRLHDGLAAREALYQPSVQIEVHLVVGLVRGCDVVPLVQLDRAAGAALPAPVVDVELQVRAVVADHDGTLALLARDDVLVARCEFVETYFHLPRQLLP